MEGKALKIQIREFYKNKKVFVTGHTGFKGSWLCTILELLGAQIHGYSLKPEEDKVLYKLLYEQRKMKPKKSMNKGFTENFGDIRDLERLKDAVLSFQPEIVFHLAAQPLVRESYDKPAYTYDVNVMGTVNLLESVRECHSVKSFVNVTTDKVYENKEWYWGYRENERLNGYDPYSNSKSCSELVTETYRRCFFDEGTAISTVRAGNVIGGGDFAKDRIIPDCVRTALGEREEKEIIVRNPHAVRPYQHVMEPLYAYLLVGMSQYESPEYQGSYNIGPDRNDCITTGDLTTLFCKAWGENLDWIDMSENNAVHEANFLALDSTKIKTILGYEATWDIKKAVEKTVEWTKRYGKSDDAVQCIKEQIKEFFEM